MRNIRKLALHLIGGEDPPAPPPHDIYAKLVAYWKMDEASGNRADSIGSYTLTDNNTVLSASALAGMYGTVADMEQANTEYLSNNAFSLGDTDWAIGIWVNFESAGANRDLFSKFVASGNQRSFEARRLNASGLVRWQVSHDGANLSTALDSVTLGALSIGTWYFVVCYHDATNNLTGIAGNGGAANTTAHSTGVFQSSAPFRVGQVDTLVASIGMDGLVGPVMVWDGYIPSQTERAWLYNSGNGRTLAEMLAYEP